MKVFQDDEAAKSFASDRLECHFTEPFIGLVVSNGEETIGAVILSDYTTGHNIEVTAVGSGWSVRVIRDIMRYCFARVKRITARTSIHNHAAIVALEQMGFKREGVMRDYFDDGDAILFGLLKSEQKIIR